LQLGLFTSLEEIASHWHREQRFEPRMLETHREQLYQGWLNAVRRVRSEA